MPETGVGPWQARRKSKAYTGDGAFRLPPDLLAYKFTL